MTNGRGPGTLAADSAADRGVPLAVLARDTQKALVDILPAHMPCANPVNVRGDAPPERLAECRRDGVARSQRRRRSRAARRPPDRRRDGRRARSGGRCRGVRRSRCSARGSARSDRPQVRAALEAGGVPDFYTPENAVEAFSFLAAYRRNQAWLLEVPRRNPSRAPSTLTAVERIRERGGNREPHAAHRSGDASRCLRPSACRCRRPMRPTRSRKRLRSRASSATRSRSSSTRPGSRRSRRCPWREPASATGGCSLAPMAKCRTVYGARSGATTSTPASSCARCARSRTATRWRSRSTPTQCSGRSSRSAPAPAPSSAIRSCCCRR